MTTFRPTVAPPGRLLRLGIVLDTGNRPERLREVARMCDGAGIESLWVRDHTGEMAGGPWLEAWTALTLASVEASHPTVGAVLSIELRRPEVLAAMAATLDTATGGRLELGFSATDVSALESYVRGVRELLAPPEAVALPVTADGAESASAASGRSCRISVEAGDEGRMAVAARVADDVLIPASAARNVREAIDGIRRACDRAGRGPATIGVALEVPVSIGRTTAEARARAAAEQFRTLGSPSEVGVFGTLEQCQERVIELAHEGVTDLRCVVPNSPDVHDVIAQLTAMAVGSVDVLTPNTPRSKSPDPPEAWGGRRIGSALRIVEPSERGEDHE